MKLSAKPALMLAVMLVLMPAQADAKNEGNRNKNHYEKNYQNNERIIIKIGVNDRTIIRNYLVNDFRRHCPPGLAKKNPPCIPPGQAKRWQAGHMLSDDIRWLPISDDLLGRLSPLPAEYQYIQVNKDVLLINTASKKIIDAVTLLSAVGE